MLEGHAQASVTGTEGKESGVSSCNQFSGLDNQGEGVKHTGAASGGDEKFSFPHGSFPSSIKGLVDSWDDLLFLPVCIYYPLNS